MSGSSFRKGDLAITTYKDAGASVGDTVGSLGESVPVRILENAVGNEALIVETLLKPGRWAVAQNWLRKVEG